MLFYAWDLRREYILEFSVGSIENEALGDVESEKDKMANPNGKIKDIVVSNFSPYSVF